MKTRESVAIVVTVALAVIIIRALQNHPGFGEATNEITKKLF